jgi:putative transcriptional regulator
VSSLAPGLIIASPPLGDPNFDRTVVLLALHGPSGALGFVMNRLAPLKLGEVMSLAGYGPRFGAVPGDVYVGGPVEPGSGWVLSGDPALASDAEGIIQISPDVSISSSRQAFDMLARDVEPSLSTEEGTAEPATAADAPKLGRRLVFLGYSGWGPGQLESEIARGAWLPAPFEPAVLFDVGIDERWEAAYKILGVSPAMSIGMRTVGDA